MADLNDQDTGQLTHAAAAVYDTAFVPSLFGQFAPWLIKFAGISRGDRILDVATGTGICALAAAHQTGDPALVTAIDINPGMLARATGKSDAIRWVEAPAEAQPFADASFDCILCQFALMFFAGRTQALAEMARVAKPDGTIAMAIWESVPNTPAYRDLIPLLDQIVGPDAASAHSAPFALGDRTELEAELAKAGLQPERIEKVTGSARHSSLDGWIDTEICGWTMADMVSPTQLVRLKAAAKDVLGHTLSADGSVTFPAPAWFVLVRN